mgnify:CR=1 FL=1
MLIHSAIIPIKSIDDAGGAGVRSQIDIDAAILPELKTTLNQAKQAIGSAERALSSDAPMQQDARDTLMDVGRAAQALRDLADYLSRHPEALIRGKQ